MDKLAAYKATAAKLRKERRAQEPQPVEAHVQRERKQVQAGHKVGDPVRRKADKHFPNGVILAITNRGTQFKVRWPDRSETQHHRDELRFL